MHNGNCQPSDKAISWNAVLGGAFVALGLTFLFNLLTIAIGLSLFTQNTAGKMILTYSGFAWILLGIFFILFISGWVAGRIVSYKHSLHCANGVLHGFLCWTVYLIISLFVLSHMASDSAAVLIKSTLVYADTNTTEVEASNAVDPEDSTTSTQIAKNTQTTQNIHKRGLATFATFFIFLLGAVGSCVGACYGISACKKCHSKYEVKSAMDNPKP